MSSNTAKPSVKETASCAWTCANFSKAPSVSYSPEFKSSNKKSRRFQLTLFQRSSDGLMGRFVVLRIENLAPNPNLKLHLKCRISVLDANDEKHCTTELNFEFCNKNWAKIFSLFEREYLTANANKYLINDQLKIYCEIDVLDDAFPANKTSLPCASDALPKITKDLQRILENGDFSDFAFIIGKKELKVHKNILSARSPVFKAMFSTDLEEKKQNRVEITDIVVEVFEQLLGYIYSGVIPKLSEYALDLFVASDKYQLAELKSLCSKLLSSSLTIETVVKILILSDMHSDGELKLSCIKFITANSIQVMQTDGWKQMVKTRVELMVELYQELAILHFAHSDR